MSSLRGPSGWFGETPGGGGGGNWLLEEDAMLQALDLMVMGECVIRDGLAVLQRRGDMLYKTRKIEMRSSRK